MLHAHSALFTPPHVNHIDRRGIAIYREVNGADFQFRAGSLDAVHPRRRLPKAGPVAFALPLLARTFVLRALSYQGSG